jgi:hypothetical protein
VAEPGPPLELELALDRAWAELAAELPAHVRAFARAHAAGAPAPPAPAAAKQAALARRALAHPALAARGLALLRLAVPVVVEGEPAVARARAGEPSWPAYPALAAARDAASRARLGAGFLGLVHVLHGAADGAADASDAALALLEPPEGWRARSRAIGPTEIDAVWRELARRCGAAGRLELVASERARPRAFVVEPGREVIAVVPARVETAAARFAVLHELGHALAGLLAPEALPRAVDEAAAAYAARAMESPAHPWHSPLAAAACARRTALARALDAIERGAASPPAGVRPPWALWHDPGAQASYVRAEQLADAWAAEAAAPATPAAPTAPAAPAAALAPRIARAAAAIDRDALARLGAGR